jgi:nucleotide-binding universal stress UspA family protein
MASAQLGAQIKLRNILYLTDFSEPSEAALLYAVTLARGYGAKVHALHILLPTPYPYAYAAPGLTAAALEAEEENAKAEMQKVESQLAGLQHETNIERGTSIWPGVEQAIQEGNIDLVVVGTHGRTGVDKLLLGSVAEEIFRRSRVPVMTIGPNARGNVHNGARFHRVLFATDLTAESLAGAPYAVSLAQENQARLLSLLVIRKPERATTDDNRLVELSAAEAMHRLYEIVPSDAKLEFPPEVAVDYGEPAERIVEIARQRAADLIVLGVRKVSHIGAATHLERATAHKVVAHALCPVLTVRGSAA